jgi:hypothetical protein
MSASIIDSNTEFVTLQLMIPWQRKFLETEETIQSALNEAGTLASGEALKQLDTDGSPIESGGMRLLEQREVGKDVSNSLWNGSP